MARNPRLPQEALLLTLEAATFKELLRDLLFREAGKPYFKSFHIPRHRWPRLLGAWRALSTYAAEHALLPVGAHNTDQRIQQFFATHARLRVEFRDQGMPVTAINVLRQRCPTLNAALEHVHLLECTPESQTCYRVALTGGPAPAPSRHKSKKQDKGHLQAYYYSE